MSPDSVTFSQDSPPRASCPHHQRSNLPLAQVASASALSDEPLASWWPPACVQFVTALPCHTTPTRPQMETKGCFCFFFFSLLLSVSSEMIRQNSDSTLKLEHLYMSSVIWKHAEIFCKSILNYNWQGVIELGSRGWSHMKSVYWVHDVFCVWCWDWFFSAAAALTLSIIL